MMLPPFFVLLHPPGMFSGRRDKPDGALMQVPPGKRRLFEVPPGLRTRPPGMDSDDEDDGYSSVATIPAVAAPAPQPSTPVAAPASPPEPKTKVVEPAPAAAPEPKATPASSPEPKAKVAEPTPTASALPKSIFARREDVNRPRWLKEFANDPEKRDNYMRGHLEWTKEQLRRQVMEKMAVRLLTQQFVLCAQDADEEADDKVQTIDYSDIPFMKPAPPHGPPPPPPASSKPVPAKATVDPNTCRSPTAAATSSSKDSALSVPTVTSSGKEGLVESDLPPPSVPADPPSRKPPKLGRPQKHCLMRCPETKLFMCPDKKCYFRSARVYSVERHFIRVHMLIRAHKCPHEACHFVGVDINDIETHLEQHDENPGLVCCSGFGCKLWLEPDQVEAHRLTCWNEITAPFTFDPAAPSSARDKMKEFLDANAAEDDDWTPSSSKSGRNTIDE